MNIFFWNGYDLSRCGIALDAWMFPLDDEVFPRVKQPLFFINSEKFQWAGNISRMRKLDSAAIQRKMITIRYKWLNVWMVPKVLMWVCSGYTEFLSFIAETAVVDRLDAYFGNKSVIPTVTTLSIIRGTVHQSFPDFTFLTGNWIGSLMKLKGEIDSELAMDLSNKASLAFLQRHLGMTNGRRHQPCRVLLWSWTQRQQPSLFVQV